MKTYLNILEENRAFAEETFAKIDKKLTAMTARSWDKLPDGVDENGMHVEKSVTWWTNGFHPAMLLLMYDATGYEPYLKLAEGAMELLEPALQDPRFAEALYQALNELCGGPAERKAALGAESFAPVTDDALNGLRRVNFGT